MLCVNWLCNTEGEGLESEREGDGGTEGEGGDEEGADEQAPNAGTETFKTRLPYYDTVLIFDCVTTHLNLVLYRHF